MNTKTNSPKHPIEVMKSKTKFQIYIYLQIYDGLTNEQLAKIMKKGKTTIYEHLQDLIEIGIVSKPEKIRDGHFLYELAPNYELIMQEIDNLVDFHQSLTPESVFTLSQAGISIYHQIIKLIEIGAQFWRKIQYSGGDSPNQEAIGLVNSMIFPRKNQQGEFIYLDDNRLDIYANFFNSIEFMGEQEFILFKDKYLQFREEFLQLAEVKTLREQEVGKSHIFVGSGFSIKKALDYINKE